MGEQDKEKMRERERQKSGDKKGGKKEGRQKRGRDHASIYRICDDDNENRLLFSQSVSYFYRHPLPSIKSGFSII